MALDLRDEMAHHVVEQRDMLVAEGVAPLQEQIGDPSQHVGALRTGAAAQRRFEFIDQ